MYSLSEMYLGQLLQNVQRSSFQEQYRTGLLGNISNPWTTKNTSEFARRIAHCRCRQDVEY